MAKRTDSMPPRRSKQSRARERAAKILRAARLELEEKAAVDISVQQIARRAEVPVGSVYHYFDGKTGLLAAVAAQVLEEAETANAKQLVDTYAMPWRDAVDVTIRNVFVFYRNRTTYGDLLRTVRSASEFQTMKVESNERLIELVSLHPAFARAGIEREQAQGLCRAIIWSTSGILDGALLMDDDERYETMANEARVLARSYLEAYVGHTD